MAKITYDKKRERRWNKRQNKQRTEKQQEVQEWDRFTKVFGRIADIDIDHACGLIAKR